MGTHGIGTNGRRRAARAAQRIGATAAAVIIAASGVEARQAVIAGAPPGTAAAAGRVAPAATGLPFRIGETLNYRASVAILGRVGTGTMRVAGPETIDGTRALLLRFDFAGRAGLFRLSDETRSWIAPESFATLRYRKVEQSPMGARREAVEIDRDAGSWSSDEGTGGSLAADAPLDELSFLFYVRTLPLETGATYRVNRHFDERRNPVTFRVLRRERVRVPAGEFASIVVEMKVVDPDRYGGEGTIVLHLSDDAQRVPLRIVSSVPGQGRITFSLESSDAETARVVGVSLTAAPAIGGDSTTH